MSKQKLGDVVKSVISDVCGNYDYEIYAGIVNLISESGCYDVWYSSADEKIYMGLVNIATLDSYIESAVLNAMDNRSDEDIELMTSKVVKGIRERY